MLLSMMMMVPARASGSAQLGLLGGLIGGSMSSFSSATQGAPTYTYTPPGNSMSDPGAGGGSSSPAQHRYSVGTMEAPAHRVKPSRKAAMLKVLSTPRRHLSAQGAGAQMLPPGCSISEPRYGLGGASSSSSAAAAAASSFSDPVYFVDAADSGSGFKR